jgi:hypothetical protein
MDIPYKDFNEKLRAIKRDPTEAYLFYKLSDKILVCNEKREIILQWPL